MKMPAGINIEFNADTTKMQLQLRAIAKHTEALANELAEIDKDVCPECGSSDVEVIRLNSDERVVGSRFICFNCEYSMASHGAVVDG